MQADEFGRMSAADLEVCREFVKARERRQDLRFGLLCSLVAGIGGTKAKPEEFFPDLVRDPTPEELELKLDAAFGAFMDPTGSST
jgi:hypothetical protein